MVTRAWEQGQSRLGRGLDKGEKSRPILTTLASWKSRRKWCGLETLRNGMREDAAREGNPLPCLHTHADRALALWFLGVPRAVGAWRTQGSQGRQTQTPNRAQGQYLPVCMLHPLHQRISA